MGDYLFKKKSPLLIGLACLFFINVSPSLFASTSRTNDITERLNKKPLLNSSIKRITKIPPGLETPNCTSLSKKNLLPDCVPQQDIDGLVLNSTLTREGYDFYVMFTHYWNPPANAVNFQIIVKEYTKAGRNTALAISLNDKELVYRVVSPSYNALNGLASAAATYLSTYLRNGNHLNGLETKSNLKDSKSDSKRITSPFDVY